jgi:acyl-CoA thioester hydrolase
VYQHQIAYVRPAQISEWVRIISRVIYFNEDTVVTEYLMLSDDRSILKTLLWVTSKHISVTTGKRIPHPPQLMEYLAAIQLPGVDFAELDFNERIREVKHALVPVS